MLIQEKIENISNPEKILTNNNKIDVNKLSNYIYSRNQVEFNKNQITEQNVKDYIIKHKSEITALYRNKVIANIRSIFKEFDYEKYIKTHLTSDESKEDFIYRSNGVITGMIKDIIKKSGSMKSFKLSSYNEAVKDIRNKFKSYIPTITCKRLELDKEIASRIPSNFINVYKSARQIKRHFTIYSGPTNSGKTYTALQQLKLAHHGIYLGPLRLLAYEKYLEFKAEKFCVSLVTGEEEIIDEYATIQCSTVEMCNLDEEYDCIVLDECQKMFDKDRGSKWTKVIIGSKCPNIHICTAPEALDTIIKLIEQCGDTYEVIKKERLVPLIEEKVYDNTIKKGDAYIVFSRRNVHALADELSRKSKLKASILYGNLPYDVRQEEARKFNTGESDILVATDVIGMGLNLPIKRVILMELDKFDGEEQRILNEDEVKQIVGRAGRFQKFPEGYYTSTNKNTMNDILQQSTINVDIPYVDMPKDLLNIQQSLRNIIGGWQQYNLEGYRKANTDMILSLCEYAEPRIKDRDLLWKVINMKFDYDSETETTSYIEWKKMVNCLAENKYYTYTYHEDYYTLLDLEREYKVYDLIYQYYFLTDDEESRKQTIDIRNNISKKIMNLIKEKGFVSKRCKMCGRKLPWNSPYGYCEKCYNKMHNEMFDDYYYDL